MKALNLTERHCRKCMKNGIKWYNELWSLGARKDCWALIEGNHRSWFAWSPQSFYPAVAVLLNASPRGSQTLLPCSGMEAPTGLHVCACSRPQFPFVDGRPTRNVDKRVSFLHPDEINSAVPELRLENCQNSYLCKSFCVPLDNTLPAFE